MPDRFRLAQKLAAHAAALDEINKIMLAPRELHQLELCRDVMHSTAELLAGDRIREIYSNDDDIADLQKLIDSEPGMREALANLDLNKLRQSQASGLHHYIHKPVLMTAGETA